MDLYTPSVPQLAKMLRNLDTWLDSAVQYAEAKSFDPEVLLGLRLAPDQYPLSRQIQSACDAAKLGAARVAGKDAPVHPDTETTLAQLKARIHDVLGYLEGFGPADFVDAHMRRISLPWMQGKWVAAPDYLFQFAIPNFYFHLVTAYSILRHSGVELGKRPYIGHMPMQDA